MSAENALEEWANAMSKYLAAHPDHDLTVEDLVSNALVRARQVPRTFTADEVVEIADETSDSLGNLYRLDFINRLRHEARTIPPASTGGAS